MGGAAVLRLLRVYGVFVLLVAAFLAAVVYLGPADSFAIAARALIGSILYRVIRWVS